MAAAVACPLQTTLPHSWQEHAAPNVQLPDIRQAGAARAEQGARRQHVARVEPRPQTLLRSRSLALNPPWVIGRRHTRLAAAGSCTP